MQAHDGVVSKRPSCRLVAMALLHVRPLGGTHKTLLICAEQQGIELATGNKIALGADERGQLHVASVYR
jgi:hypothetical protein